jgi:hypothetical protein
VLELRRFEIDWQVEVLESGALRELGLVGERARRAR